MAHLISIAGAANIKSHSLTSNHNNNNNNRFSTTISQSQVPQRTRNPTLLHHQYHMPLVTSSARAACLSSSTGQATTTTTTTMTTIYSSPNPLSSGTRFGRNNLGDDNSINIDGSGGDRDGLPTGQIVVDVVSVTVSPPLYHEIPGTVPAYQGRSSGPPPSYDDVINPNAPPPSYQSLFGQVREARKSSSGLMDLLRQLFLILISTLGCTIIIGFIILIPITMIVIGVIYINDCKAENIPIFLVIGGLVWITKNVLNCYNQFKKETSSPIRSSSSTTSSSSSSHTSTSSANRGGSRSSTETYDHFIERGGRPSNINNHHNGSTQNSRSLPSSSFRSFEYESLINIFLVGWFVASCIIVYRVYEPEYENTVSSRYCNRTVYLYAFWLFSSTFIIFAVFLSCMCCLMLSSVIASHQEDGAS